MVTPKKTIVWLLVAAIAAYIIYTFYHYKVNRMDSPFKYFGFNEFDSGAMPDEVTNPNIKTYRHPTGKHLLEGSGKEHMDPDFIHDLDAVREEVGFPIVVMPGNGYRSDRYNTKVGGVSNSSHRRRGVAKVQAADLVLPTMAMKEAVIKAAIKRGITRFGIGNGTLLHLDKDPTKTQKITWGYGGSSAPSYSSFT